MKNLIVILGLGIYFCSNVIYGYDTCKDKSIEFCIEEDKAPVFDYEPKKIKKKVVKRKAAPKKKVVLDTSSEFRRGEIDKEVEMLGYSGSGDYATISSEGFNPDKDYFIEDKSGPEEILIDGTKVRVRKISRGNYKGSGMKPSGVMTRSGQKVADNTSKIQLHDKSTLPQVENAISPSVGEDQIAETTFKRIFTTDKNGKVVAKEVKVTTYIRKPVINKAKSTQVIAKKKSFWGNMATKYQNFKKNIFLPKYHQAKAKIKSLFNRFFNRKK